MIPAEGEGFEPPVLAHSCFQDSYHKPLGHPSGCEADTTQEHGNVDPSWCQRPYAPVLEPLLEAIDEPFGCQRAAAVLPPNFAFSGQGHHSSLIMWPWA